MIYTIVDKNTGKEIRGQVHNKVGENEAAIDTPRTTLMEDPYYNFDTQEYYDKGEYVEIKEIPDVKPMYIRFVLKQMGILSVIESHLNKPENEMAKIAFDYTVNFKRNNVMINQMAPLLGLSSEQVDQLFLNAYAIEQGEVT